jgi:hypothetical protein
LYIDDNLEYSWTATTDWEQVSCYLSPGQHQIKLEGNVAESSKSVKSTTAGGINIDNVGAVFGFPVGKPYGKGLIVYSNWKKNIVLAGVNVGNISWDDGIEKATEATDTSGFKNTNRIISVFGAGDYAAQLAKSYNADGNNTWFLPSYEELGCIRSNWKKFKGFFPNGEYWSSTDRGFCTSSPPGPTYAGWMARWLCLTDAELCPNQWVMNLRGNAHYVLAVREVTERY